MIPQNPPPKKGKLSLNLKGAILTVFYNKPTVWNLLGHFYIRADPVKVLLFWITFWQNESKY